MLRKLVYTGKEEIRIIFPIDMTVSQGTEIEVANKEESEALQEIGFREVATGKEEIERKQDKKTNKKDGEA